MLELDCSVRRLRIEGGDDVLAVSIVTLRCALGDSSAETVERWADDSSELFLCIAGNGSDLVGRCV
jgi:hypothetical protein